MLKETPMLCECLVREIVFNFKYGETLIIIKHQDSIIFSIIQIFI